MLGLFNMLKVDISIAKWQWLNANYHISWKDVKYIEMADATFKGGVTVKLNLPWTQTLNSFILSIFHWKMLFGHHSWNKIKNDK